MYEVQLEEEKKPLAFLTGIFPDNLSELKGLIWTLGMECAGTVILPRQNPHPAYGMGSGKAREIADAAKEAAADCIIMDFELEPTKQRNWETLAQMPVFDRQEVIIRIFAARAKTREAVLQVELARLEYSLPRLAHMYGDMARQRGGNYGAKGAGEKQLELDRRQVREKIQRLRAELKKVRLNRSTQRKRREKVPLPSVALAGYTNAGKSSLMNVLTGADSFVEDKLFATLDPLTRKIKLKPQSNGGKPRDILLTDTVGFISALPHSLIDAFKSTLEEAVLADLLLIVIDASDENAESHVQTIHSVLSEIGAAEKKRITVLNKMDKIPEDGVQLNRLKNLFPDAIEASAKKKIGLEKIMEKIEFFL